MTASLAEARSAKRYAHRIFDEYGQLAGIGITRSPDGFKLKVNFVSAPGNIADVPREFDGVPVEIAIVGSIQAQT
jgi:hypothetical protein